MACVGTDGLGDNLLVRCLLHAPAWAEGVLHAASRAARLLGVSAHVAAHGTAGLTGLGLAVCGVGSLPAPVELREA